MITPMLPLDLALQKSPIFRSGHEPAQILVGLPNPIKVKYFSSYDRDILPAWCSAANPFSEQIKFAVGFDGSVKEISAGEEDFSCLSNTMGEDEAIFGVDWLDHNTIVSGGRQGNVCLWDTRARGQSMRFRHPAQINHVRKLKGSQVAVAGINESVSSHTRDPPPSPPSCKGFFQNPTNNHSPLPCSVHLDIHSRPPHPPHAESSSALYGFHHLRRTGPLALNGRFRRAWRFDRSRHGGRPRAAFQRELRQGAPHAANREGRKTPTRGPRRGPEAMFEVRRR